MIDCVEGAPRGIAWSGKSLWKQEEMEGLGKQ